MKLHNPIKWLKDYGDKMEQQGFRRAYNNYLNMEINKLAVKTLNELKCGEIHIMPFMEWLRLKNDALKTEEWPIGI